MHHQAMPRRWGLSHQRTFHASSRENSSLSFAAIRRPNHDTAVDEFDNKDAVFESNSNGICDETESLLNAHHVTKGQKSKSEHDE
jgi:hypothetical protein